MFNCNIAAKQNFHIKPVLQQIRLLTLSLLKRPKAAGRKCHIFPRASKSGHEKRVQKNALYTLGKAVFVNTYCSIVMGRHKPIKSQEVRIQNYCMRRVVKGRSLASLQDVRA